eukprot:4855724-Amphidinium_carterae.3
MLGHAGQGTPQEAVAARAASTEAIAKPHTSLVQGSAPQGYVGQGLPDRYLKPEQLLCKHDALAWPATISTCFLELLSISVA